MTETEQQTKQQEYAQSLKAIEAVPEGLPHMGPFTWPMYEVRLTPHWASERVQLRRYAGVDGGEAQAQETAQMWLREATHPRDMVTIRFHENDQTSTVVFRLRKSEQEQGK